MAEHTVWCEECVEDLPANEVLWDSEDGRLYCKRCGSEVEPPERDIFEEIVDNRTAFVFRDQSLADEDDEDKENEVEDAESDPIVQVNEDGDDRDEGVDGKKRLRVEEED